MMSIYCPVIYGNGAYVLHEKLSQKIKNYEIFSISPYAALCPKLMSIYKKENCIIHSSPDLGPYILSNKSINILTFHGFRIDREFIDFSSVAQKFYYKNILAPAIVSAVKNADILTGVSHFIADLAKNTLNIKKDIHVIENGVDHNKFIPVKEKKPADEKIKILYVGAFKKAKGFHLIEMISDKLPKNTQIIMIGSDKHGDKKEGKISWLGRVLHEDMPFVYQDCDILLFPTFREGFGLVVAEAMACGLPVVTSNKSTMPELIHHGKGGYLTDFGDVDAMSMYLKKLIENPSLRADMGAYNRERILQQYTEEKMMIGYNELFSLSKDLSS